MNIQMLLGIATPSTTPAFEHHDAMESGMKYLLPPHTRIESTTDGRYTHEYKLFSPKNYPIIMGGLLLEQTGRSFGEYKRIGTVDPHFRSNEQVQDWNKQTETLPPDLGGTDYVRRCIDKDTRHERCTSKSSRYPMSTGLAQHCWFNWLKRLKPKIENLVANREAGTDIQCPRWKLDINLHEGRGRTTFKDFRRSWRGRLWMHSN